MLESPRPSRRTDGTAQGGAARRRRNGQRQRLGDHAPRGGPARRVWRALRSARRVGAPDAGRHVRIRRGCRAARPARDHRRRRRRGAPSRACLPRRPPCRCSACRSRRSTSAARIRCFRSCRCRRVSPSRRSRSARPAPPTRALFAVAMLAGTDPALAKRLAAFRAKQTDAARAMRVPPATLTPTAWRALRAFRPAPGSGLLGGGQLGRMFCMAAQSLGYKVAVLDPGGDIARRAASPTVTFAPTTSIRAAWPSSRRSVARRRPNSRTCRRPRSSFSRATRA